MKLTSDIQNGFLRNIKSITIVFEDNEEVILDNIYDFDFDLDSIESSWIDVTNAYINKTLVDRFASKKENSKIKHININYINLDIKYQEAIFDAFIDIPCCMSIRKLRINGDTDSCGKMYVRLEGWVK